MSDSLLLTRCRLDRHINCDVIVYGGVPTIRGMDTLIEMLISLRNGWREPNDDGPLVRYTPKRKDRDLSDE